MGSVAIEIDGRESASARINQAIDRISDVILGKDQQVRLALTCMVAHGHLLIEDLPGVGKTTLAHTIARVMGMDFKRIQFTSDLLPADVLGVAVYTPGSGSFEFHPGPVFSNFVLADEVNRATPKTQSALLEAMEEHQVTVEGETRELPDPFFVIATQNPMHQIGTYPLPESQLDRFLLRIHLGFPDAAAERELLMGDDRRQMVDALEPVLDTDALIDIQRIASGLHVSDALVDYVQRILEFSRTSPMFESGLSPRGGLALVNAARAWALIDDKDFVIPEHVKTVMPAVVDHRLVEVGDELRSAGKRPSDLIAETVSIN